MDSYEVAKWLYSCDDIQFAETFALFYKMLSGMGEDISITKEMVTGLDIKRLCMAIGRDLEEIVFSEEVCTNAWWKSKDSEDRNLEG